MRLASKLLISLVTLLVVAASPAALEAQAPATAGEAGAAASTITADDLRRHMGVLAADSMKGRDTPSPGLTATAEYVAGRFREFGLQPGLGDSYQQEYPLTLIHPPGPGDLELELSGEGRSLGLEAGSQFAPLGAGGEEAAEGPVHVPSDAADSTELAGAVMLLEAPASGLQGALSSIRERLEDSGAAAAILAVDLPESRFAQISRFLQRERLQLGEPAPLETPVVIVQIDALPEALRTALEAPGRVEGWEARVRAHARLEATSAMNTIGWIEGSDPARRDEFVIYTAHMDHLGVGEPVDGDSIYNGADDDASGTATIIELAEAFASAAEPPRRSVVFMTVSGEEKGLLGSRWYTDHPVFPLEGTVANINMDMIGRNWRDTVVAIGQDHSTLGSTVSRVTADHPELGMTVIRDRWPEQRFYFRSDHYNFARSGVPAVFFFSGIHEDYHRPSDEVEDIMYGKTARIGQLLYHLGRAVADADERPEWDPASYREIVEGGS